MNIELRRIRFRPESIDGQIWIDGEKICSCAENANHCLTVGTYPISIIKCKQYARKMPKIEFMDNSRVIYGNSCLDEKPCVSCHKLPFVCNNTTLPVLCPMLKPGNGVYNRTDGSIIVGRYIAPGCLSHPKQAFDALYQRIRKNIERGNEVTLTINR